MLVLRRRTLVKVLWLLLVSFYFFIRPAFPKHPFPIHESTPKPADADDDLIPKWWESPALPDLTRRELSLLRWFGSITTDLPKAERERIWSMRGGKPLGPDQLGFTAVRYHLAFTGYAMACALQRTPAYVGRTRRLLGSVMEMLLEPRVWGYMEHYWTGDQAKPFTCNENVMYR